MSDPNLMSGIDDGEQVRQNVNQVTEEAVKRVQASSAQAKKIQSQIKQDKAVNNNLASFLQFLLKVLKSDNLVSSLYKTFFIVTNQKTGAKYYKKQINNIVIVGFFAPFFWNQIEKYGLQNYYADIKPEGNITLAAYIDYIKKLSAKHHDNIPIDKDSLLDLLCQIILEFGLGGHELKGKEDIVPSIKKALTSK